MSATTIEMNERSVYSRRDGWISAWVGDELIMMSAESSVYLSLSHVGGRIWELLEAPRTANCLCQALATEYAIGSVDIRAEVLAFLEKLVTQDAIEVDSQQVV